MSDAKKPADPAAKKKPPVLIIVVAVVAILGGLMAGKMVAAKGTPEGGKASKEKEKKEKGVPLPLDEFLVNLTDAGGEHFLKVKMALEISKKAGKGEEALKEEVPSLRDAVLSCLTDKSRADLAGKKGRAKLKKEIVEKVNEEAGEELAQGVFFTDFVMQ